MRRVEARLSDSRSMVAISRTVGKEENSSGALDEQRRHQDQHRQDDRNGEAISRSVAEWQDEDDQDRAMMPIASARSPRLSIVPRSPSLDMANPQADAAYRTITHLFCRCPRADRGHEKICVAAVRPLTRVRGTVLASKIPSRVRRGSECSPAKICPFMVSG